MAKILVEATDIGADRTGLRRPGDRFEIEEAAFTDVWMRRLSPEPVEEPPDPEAERLRQEKADRMRRINAARLAKRAEGQDGA